MIPTAERITGRRRPHTAHPPQGEYPENPQPQRPWTQTPTDTTPQLSGDGPGRDGARGPGTAAGTSSCRSSDGGTCSAERRRARAGRIVLAPTRLCLGPRPDAGLVFCRSYPATGGGGEPAADQPGGHRTHQHLDMDASREGADSSQEGANRKREGTNGSREGINSNREAAKISREGTNSSREGAKISREGTNSSREGAKISREGTNSSREGAKISREGTNSSKEGDTISREGTNSSREEYTINREGASSSREGAKISRKGTKISREGAKSSRDGANSSQEGNRAKISREGTKKNREGAKISLGVNSSAEGAKISRESTDSSREGARISREGTDSSREGAKLSGERARIRRESTDSSRKGAKISREGTNSSREGAMISREGAKISREGAKISRDGANSSREGNRAKISKEGTKKPREGAKISREGNRAKISREGTDSSREGTRMSGEGIVQSMGNGSSSRPERILSGVDGASSHSAADAGSLKEREASSHQASRDRSNSVCSVLDSLASTPGSPVSSGSGAVGKPASWSGDAGSIPSTPDGPTPDSDPWQLCNPVAAAPFVLRGKLSLGEYVAWCRLEAELHTTGQRSEQGFCLSAEAAPPHRPEPSVDKQPHRSKQDSRQTVEAVPPNSPETSIDRQSQSNKQGFCLSSEAAPPHRPEPNIDRQSQRSKQGFCQSAPAAPPHRPEPSSDREAQSHYRQAVVSRSWLSVLNRDRQQEECLPCRTRQKLKTTSAHNFVLGRQDQTADSVTQTSGGAVCKQHQAWDWQSEKGGENAGCSGESRRGHSASARSSTSPTRSQGAPGEAPQPSLQQQQQQRSHLDPFPERSRLLFLQQRLEDIAVVGNASRQARPSTSPAEVAAGPARPAGHARVNRLIRQAQLRAARDRTTRTHLRLAHAPPASCVVVAAPSVQGDEKGAGGWGVRESSGPVSLESKMRRYARAFGVDGKGCSLGVRLPRGSEG